MGDSDMVGGGVKGAVKSNGKWYELEKLDHLPISVDTSVDSSPSSKTGVSTPLEPSEDVKAEYADYGEMPRSLERSRPVTLLGASSTDDIINVGSESPGHWTDVQEENDGKWYSLKEAAASFTEKDSRVSSSSSAADDRVVALTEASIKTSSHSISSYHEIQRASSGQKKVSNEFQPAKNDHIPGALSRDLSLQPLGGSTGTLNGKYEVRLLRRENDGSPQLVVRPEPLGRAKTESDVGLLSNNVVVTPVDLDDTDSSPRSTRLSSPGSSWSSQSSSHPQALYPNQKSPDLAEETERGKESQSYKSTDHKAVFTNSKHVPRERKLNSNLPVEKEESQGIYKEIMSTDMAVFSGVEGDKANRPSLFLNSIPGSSSYNSVTNIQHEDVGFSDISPTGDEALAEAKIGNVLRKEKLGEEKEGQNGVADHEVEAKLARTSSSGDSVDGKILDKVIQETDPMILAASALQVSSLLSRQTEESIKRAGDVLASIRPNLLSRVSEEESGGFESSISNLQMSSVRGGPGVSSTASLTQISEESDVLSLRGRRELGPSAEQSIIYKNAGIRQPIYSRSPLLIEGVILKKRAVSLAGEKLSIHVGSKSINSTFFGESFSSSSSELMRLKSSSESTYLRLNSTGALTENGYSFQPGANNQRRETQSETDSEACEPDFSSEIGGEIQKLRKLKTVVDLTKLSGDKGAENLPYLMGAGVITPIESSSECTCELSDSSIPSDHSKKSGNSSHVDFLSERQSSDVQEPLTDVQPILAYNVRLKNGLIDSRGIKKLTGINSFHGYEGGSTSTPNTVGIDMDRQADLNSVSAISSYLSRPSMFQPSLNGVKDPSMTSFEKLSDFKDVSLQPSDATSDSTSYKFLLHNTMEKGEMAHDRGIYDVRDSSGPGSTNRRRKALGKSPITKRQYKSVDHSLYVSGSSKDTLTSGVASTETSDVASTETSDVAHPPSDGASTLSKETGTVPEKYSENHNGFSAQEKSNDTDELISEAATLSRQVLDICTIPTRNDIETRSYPPNSTVASRRVLPHYEGNIDVMSGTAKAFLESGSTRPLGIRQRNGTEAWSAPVGKRGRSRVPKDINELYGKFLKEFKLSGHRVSGVISEKVNTLASMLAGDKKASVEESTDSRHMESQKKFATATKPMLMRQNVSRGDGKENGKALVYVCERCNVRDVGTNCPSPSIPDRNTREDERSKSPLTLHTWTQTTPAGPLDGGKNVYISDSFARKESAKRTKGAEVIALPANFAVKTGKKHSAERIDLKKDEHFSAWDVRFPSEKVKKAQKPNIEGGDRRLGQRRKGEALYTAWFQSARSDTSENTVVPLTEVPGLGEAYKEGHRPKMLIEERKMDSAPTLKRLTLQEAFLLAKRDFISNLRERQREVKNVKFNLNREKRLDNLKEQPIDSFAGKQTQINNILKSKSDRLFKPSKRHMTKTEMKELNARLYHKLPEVIKQREEEKRTAQYQSNRAKLKEYDQHVRQRWQRKRNLSKGR